MFETEKAWSKKEVEVVADDVAEITAHAEAVIEQILSEVEEVALTLIKPHTHAGVAMQVGDEITTYLQQARWLQNMQVAVIKNSTQE